MRGIPATIMRSEGAKDMKWVFAYVGIFATITVQMQYLVYLGMGGV
jgi:hypothetical protein